MADGYRCELCGFEIEGNGAQKRFEDHARAHEWRERYARLLTALTEDDKVFLKIQRIAHEGLTDEQG